VLFRFGGGRFPHPDEYIRNRLPILGPVLNRAWRIGGWQRIYHGKDAAKEQNAPEKLREKQIRFHFGYHGCRLSVKSLYYHGTLEPLRGRVIRTFRPRSPALFQSVSPESTTPFPL